MEVTNQQKFRWTVSASAITVGMAVFLLLFPFLVPVVTVIMWLKFRGSTAVIPYVLYLGAVYLTGYSYAFAFDIQNLSAVVFAGVFTAALFILTFPATLTAVVAHRSGRRMYDSVLWTTLASFISAGAFVAMIYLFTGESLTDVTLGMLTRSMKSNPALLDSTYAAFTQFFGLFGETAPAVETVSTAQKMTYVSEQFSENLPVFLGSTVIKYSLLTGLLSYYVPAAFLQKKDVALTPTPLFKNLRIPRPEWVVLALILLVSFFLLYNPNDNVTVVAAVLQSSIRLVFTIQGLSLLTYLYQSKRISLVFYLILIVTGLAFRVTFWLGIMEALLNLRGRIETINHEGGE